MKQDDVNLFWKLVFMIFGIGIFTWGIIVDSLARTMGGLGLIIIFCLIRSER